MDKKGKNSGSVRKGIDNKLGVLTCVEYIQTLFDRLTRVLFNFCNTASLLTSSSTSWGKSIDLPVIGSFLVNMEAKAKLKVEYIDIDRNILQNPAYLLNPDRISNFGIQISE